MKLTLAQFQHALTAGHHEEGGEIYADTAFLNAMHGVPGAEVRHLGFGEFEISTPKGSVEVDRMRGKDFEGQSGRSHKLYDSQRGSGALKWLMKEVEKRGVSQKMSSSEEIAPIEASPSMFGSYPHKMDAYMTYLDGIAHYAEKKGLVFEKDWSGYGYQLRGRNAQRLLPKIEERVWDEMYDLDEVTWGRRRRARFEEGKPADPTKNMSPEEAKEWRENTEKYRDKFKSASRFGEARKNMKAASLSLDEFKSILACGDGGCQCGGNCGCGGGNKKARFEEGTPADPTKNMSPEDAEEWRENTEKYRDKFKTAAKNWWEWGETHIWEFQPTSGRVKTWEGDFEALKAFLKRKPWDGKVFVQGPGYGTWTHVGSPSDVVNRVSVPSEIQRRSSLLGFNEFKSTLACGDGDCKKAGDKFKSISGSFQYPYGVDVDRMKEDAQRVLGPHVFRLHKQRIHSAGPRKDPYFTLVVQTHSSFDDVKNPSGPETPPPTRQQISAAQRLASMYGLVYEKTLPYDQGWSMMTFKLKDRSIPRWREASGEKPGEWVSQLIEAENSGRIDSMHVPRNLYFDLIKVGQKFSAALIQIVDDVTEELDIDIGDLFRRSVRVRSMAEVAEMVAFASYQCLDGDDSFLKDMLSKGSYPIFKRLLHDGKVRAKKNAVDARFEHLLSFVEEMEEEEAERQLDEMTYEQGTPYWEMDAEMRLASAHTTVVEFQSPRDATRAISEMEEALGAFISDLSWYVDSERVSDATKLVFLEPKSKATLMALEALRASGIRQTRYRGRDGVSV